MLSPYEIVVWTTYGISQLLNLILLVMSVFAFVEALRASSSAYISSARKSKGFWLAVTGACLVFSILSLAWGVNQLMLQLIVATAAGVFLADVRPAVRIRR